MTQTDKVRQRDREIEKFRRRLQRNRNRRREKGAGIYMYTNKEQHLPSDIHFFFGINLKMKSHSNMIPFDFVLKINFDRDFILKRMPKSEHPRGIW